MRPSKVLEVAAWRRIDLAELPCRYGIGRLSAELYPSEGLELLLRVYLPQGAQPPHRDALRVEFVDGDSRTLIEVRESWDDRPRAGRRAEMQATASWQLPWPADPLGDAAVAIAIDDHEVEIGSWCWVDGALRCLGRFDVATPTRDRHYARLTVRVGEEQFALSVPSSFTGHVATADHDRA